MLLTLVLSSLNVDVNRNDATTDHLIQPDRCFGGLVSGVDNVQHNILGLCVSTHIHEFHLHTVIYQLMIGFLKLLCFLEAENSKY